MNVYNRNKMKMLKNKCPKRQESQNWLFLYPLYGIQGYLVCVLSVCL